VRIQKGQKRGQGASENAHIHINTLQFEQPGGIGQCLQMNNSKEILLINWKETLKLSLHEYISTFPVSTHALRLLPPKVGNQFQRTHCQCSCCLLQQLRVTIANRNASYARKIKPSTKTNRSGPEYARRLMLCHDLYCIIRFILSEKQESIRHLPNIPHDTAMWGPPLPVYIVSTSAVRRVSSQVKFLKKLMFA
jgi:hypothetical protein